ncbi:MAG: SurA N-terminal domain-containing protein [Treponema sp.]|nr:SurA N-terminal domain-containing protein [Treponema sp.]
MKKAVIIIIFGVLVTFSVSSQAGLQPVATVNLIRTEAITVQQHRNEVQKMEKTAGRSLSPAERRQVLDLIINERLALQAAERDKVTITDNEVNQQIQQLRTVLAQQVGRQPTDAEFNQAIVAESGMELSAFRDQLRRQMIVQKYLVTKKEKLINSIKPPTEAEIIAEYNLSRSSFIRPETIRFSMIQIPYGPDAASRTNAKQLADRLVREIGTNATKFDEVSARSVATNSGYVAGDAGYLPRTQEVRNLVGQAFMDTAFSLRQGQVSSLVEGVQGFHIVKVTENYAQKNLELDDILQLGTRITVKDYIGQRMFEHRQQIILTQASEELIGELRTNRSFQVMEANLNW